MTIKRLLRQLEQSASKNGDELHFELCRLLGIVDAATWPPRAIGGQHSNFHALMAAQRAYFTDGIRFTVEGSNQAGWKQSERVRTALIGEGWAVGMPGGRIQLTTLGDCVGRQLAGLPTINHVIGHFLFDRLGTLPRECQSWRGDWVSEQTLFLLDAETARDYDVLHERTEFMKPLIVGRFVETNSSTVARVFYQRTADSLPVVDVTLEHRSECSDAYTSEFCRCMDARKQAVHDSPEIWIPLSATQ